MKLVQFSLEKFRNFVDKQTINFTNNSVIIGPNNGGKTNILRALVISWDFLMGIAVGRNHCSFINNKLVCNECKPNSNKDIVDQTIENEPFSVYNWQRDYPISLQEEKPEDILNKTSTFILCFQITDEEKIEINNIIHSSTNISLLQIIFTMGINRFSLSFPSLIITDSSIQEMVKYVAKKISIFYIDAVRTARGALSMINNLFEMELRNLYSSKEYLKQEEQLNNLIYPSIENLLNILNQKIKFFVPSIQENSLTYYHTNRPLRDLRLFLDDGNNTEISQKGSGIQSLVAISLAHIITSKQIHSDNLVLAIEEPEAHLHPQGIHEIKKILFDIAKRNQLIITTHSPLLANTNDISSNIIVSNNVAIAAKSIKEIRDTLGIIASDNLMFADNNILVEGLSDERIIKTILSEKSTNIKNAFDAETLKIINCDGCSKISAFISLMKVYISRYHVILDGDKDGVDEKRRIEKKDPSISGCITTFSALGMQESEIEDFIDPDSYIDKLATTFSLNNLRTLKKALNDIDKKWSERLSVYGGRNGRRFENEDIFKAKTIVADAVVEKGISALRTCRSDIFDTLVANIERMLDE